MNSKKKISFNGMNSSLFSSNKSNSKNESDLKSKSLDITKLDNDKKNYSSFPSFNSNKQNNKMKNDKGNQETESNTNNFKSVKFETNPKNKIVNNPSLNSTKSLPSYPSNQSFSSNFKNVFDEDQKFNSKIERYMAINRNSYDPKQQKYQKEYDEEQYNDENNNDLLSDLTDELSDELSNYENDENDENDENNDNYDDILMMEKNDQYDELYENLDNVDENGDSYYGKRLQNMDKRDSSKKRKLLSNIGNKYIDRYLTGKKGQKLKSISRKIYNDPKTKNRLNRLSKFIKDKRKKRKMLMEDQTIDDEEENMDVDEKQKSNDKLKKYSVYILIGILIFLIIIFIIALIYLSYRKGYFTTLFGLLNGQQNGINSLTDSSDLVEARNRRRMNKTNKNNNMNRNINVVNDPLKTISRANTFAVRKVGKNLRDRGLNVPPSDAFISPQINELNDQMTINNNNNNNDALFTTTSLTGSLTDTSRRITVVPN